MTNNIEVVVVGGGYAGLMAANRLTQRDDLRVTLINPRDKFVERMRLHQLVGGSDDAVVAFPGLLADRVRLIVDCATRIDTSERAIHLESGGIVDYDYLIYAVGSDAAQPDVLGGVEFAVPFGTLESANRLRALLDAAPKDVAVTVVGAGATGIELAAELSEVGRQVTLVCGELLGAYLHPRGRRLVAKQLGKLGVSIVEGNGSRVTEVTREAVHLSDGSTIPSTLTIWTAGFSVPDLATRSGLSTDSSGRLVCDETLTSLDDPHIIVAGDCAAPSRLPYRMSAFAAQRLGAHAADTVLSRIGGVEPEALELGFVGVCIGLGRGTAAIQIADSQDHATGFALAGRAIAFLVKEKGTQGVIRFMAREGRKPGSHKLRQRDATRTLRAATALNETLVR